MASDRPMQLGMVGLGRMGANLTRRLMRDGHRMVAHDVSPDAVAQLASEGATGATTLDEFVAALERPRAVWVMVPAGEITEKTVQALADRLDADDVIVDGGNTYYRDDIRRADELQGKGIHYVDVGTSGGGVGLERGVCLMIGGGGGGFERLGPPFLPHPPGRRAPGG